MNVGVDVDVDVDVGGERPLWQEVLSIVATVIWGSESFVQAIENYRLKNMEGYNYDFFILAVNGGVCYLLYCCIGFFTNIPGAGTVVFGDLIYPFCLCLMLIVQRIQFAIYPAGKNKITFSPVFFCILIWVIVIANVFLIQLFHIIPRTEYWNVVSILGYGKLSTAFLKYLPFLYWNYKRKTTKGVPVVKVILDVLGGGLSFISGAVSTDNGLNITKLALAIFTLFFDFIFLIQRYILYPPPKPSSKSDCEHLIQKPINKKINND